MNIRSGDSPVTLYIQHPIPIPAPGDKNKAELRPLKLTTKVGPADDYFLTWWR
jgi:U4/U6 small nuclear ribonucleoprotein PRP3